MIVKRFFGLVGIAAFAAMVGCCLLPLHVAMVLGGVCLLGVLVALLAFRGPKTAMVTVLLTAAVAIASFSVKTLCVRQPLAAWDGETATVTATVTEITKQTDGVSYVLSVVEGDLPVGTRLSYHENSDRVREFGEGLCGELSLVSADYPFLFSKDIYLYAWPSGGTPPETVEVPPPTWFDRVLYDCRRMASERLTPSGSETDGVCAGICVGDTSLITPKTEDAFRRAGISHLLVVSGLHLSLLVLGSFALLRRFLRSKTAAIVLMPVLAAFCLLMGMTPSVVRSGVMMGVILLGYLFSRPSDSLNSMGLAFALLTAFDPFCIYDVGLLLSFGATLGILLLYRPIRRWSFSVCHLSYPERGAKRLLAAALSAAAVTLSATSFVLPVTAFFFGEISLLSLPANLLAVWPAEAVLVLGWLSLLLGVVPFVGEWIGMALLWIAERFSDYLIRIAHLFGDLPWATFSMREDYLRWWLVGAIALLSLGYFLCRKRGLSLAALFSVAALALGMGAHTWLSHGVTTVSAAHASGGYAVLVEHNGTAGMILEGDTASWKLAARLMKENGLVALDFVAAGDGSDGRAAFADHYDVARFIPLPRDEQTALSDEISEWVWGTHRLETQSGFVRLSVGHTAILLCPSGKDAGVLTADWRYNHLTLYVDRPPSRIERLSALQAVWLCDTAKRKTLTAALPWGAYPIELQNELTPSVWMTRGNGDLTAAVSTIF